MLANFFFFIFGILLCGGLPLIGWGIDDAAGFAANTARSAFIAIISAMTLLSAFIVPHRREKSGLESKLVKRQRKLILAQQLITILMTVLAPFSDRRGIAVFTETGLVREAGLLAVFAGFGLLNWTLFVLGKRSGVDIVSQFGQELETSGPYRLVRYPRYLGILLLLGGGTLVFRSWGTALLWILLLVVILWRIRDEEALLQAEFPQEWMDCQQRFWKLLPFIY